MKRIWCACLVVLVAAIAQARDIPIHKNALEFRPLAAAETSCVSTLIEKDSTNHQDEAFYAYKCVDNSNDGVLRGMAVPFLWPTEDPGTIYVCVNAYISGTTSGSDVCVQYIIACGAGTDLTDSSASLLKGTFSQSSWGNGGGCANVTVTATANQQCMLRLYRDTNGNGSCTDANTDDFYVRGVTFQ